MTVTAPRVFRHTAVPGLLVLALAVIALVARCVASVHFSSLPPLEVHVFSATLVDICILPFWLGALVASIIGIRRSWAGPWCGVAVALAVASPVTGSLINTVRTLAE